MTDSAEPSLRALLLLGPTGAGKTPLGQLLERCGLCGRRCAHFDFGHHLRMVASGKWSARRLGATEIAVVRLALSTGALLEDHEFYIAREILRSFADERGLSAEDLVVLNGLPRHAGQAAALAPFVNLMAVVVLKCPPEVAHARIRLDTGGDRGGRLDDTLEAVRRRLIVFDERTLPLVEFYRSRDVPILELVVTAETSANELLERLGQHVQRMSLWDK
jgi:adenylate kinase family enzyme